MGLEERVKRLEEAAGVNASTNCAHCDERERKQLENERGGRREGWATETSRSDANCPACGREFQIVVRVLERAA